MFHRNVISIVSILFLFLFARTPVSALNNKIVLKYITVALYWDLSDPYYSLFNLLQLKQFCIPLLPPSDIHKK
jgi:hypothetical protein